MNSLVFMIHSIFYLKQYFKHNHIVLVFSLFFSFITLCFTSGFLHFSTLCLWSGLFSYGINPTTRHIHPSDWEIMETHTFIEVLGAYDFPWGAGDFPNWRFIFLDSIDFKNPWDHLELFYVWSPCKSSFKQSFNNCNPSYHHL